MIGHRLAVEQRSDVVALDLDRGRVLHGHGQRLVWRRGQHGGQPEHLAVARRVDDDLLIVLVDHDDLHLPSEHHVRLAAGIPGLADAVPGLEASQLHLLGQHARSSASSSEKIGMSSKTVGSQGISRSLRR
jgi:hypothetical protein